MARIAYTKLSRADADMIIAAARHEPGAEIQLIAMTNDEWAVTIVTPPDTAAALLKPARLATVAAAPAAAPTATAASDQCLGALSACFESNGKPGAIGFDRVGGYSYGCYQIAARPGTLKDFLRFLTLHHPREAQVLEAAGGNEAGKAGTEMFKQAWRTLAQEPAFMDIQHEYIKSTHYDVFAAKLNRDLHLDLNAHSQQLRDVAWSVAVQHGPGNRVFDSALGGHVAPDTNDADIIRAVYKERSNVKKYFSNSSPQVQGAILKRYATERARALRGL